MQCSVSKNDCAEEQTGSKGGLLERAPRSPVVPGVVQRNTLELAPTRRGGLVGGGWRLW